MPGNQVRGTTGQATAVPLESIYYPRITLALPLSSSSDLEVT